MIEDEEDGDEEGDGSDSEEEFDELTSHRLSVPKHRQPSMRRSKVGQSNQNNMSKGNPVNVDFRTFILPSVPQDAAECIA